MSWVESSKVGRSKRTDVHYRDSWANPGSDCTNGIKSDLSSTYLQGSCTEQAGLGVPQPSKSYQRVPTSEIDHHLQRYLRNGSSFVPIDDYSRLCKYKQPKAQPKPSR